MEEELQDGTRGDESAYRTKSSEIRAESISRNLRIETLTADGFENLFLTSFHQFRDQIHSVTFTSQKRTIS